MEGNDFCCFSYIDSSGVSGPIPEEFAKLKSLHTMYLSIYHWKIISKDVVFDNIDSYATFWFSFACFSWASDNHFTGKIPDYLGTFTELRDLYACFPLL